MSQTDAKNADLSLAERYENRITYKSYEAGVSALTELTPVQELALVREKRLAMLDALTPKKMFDATVPSLVRGVSDLFQVEQLMQERPTTIILHHERAGMLELAKALLAEKERRQQITVIEVPTHGTP